MVGSALDKRERTTPGFPFQKEPPTPHRMAIVFPPGRAPQGCYARLRRFALDRRGRVKHSAIIGGVGGFCCRLTKSMDFPLRRRLRKIHGILMLDSMVTLSAAPREPALTR